MDVFPKIPITFYISTNTGSDRNIRPYIQLCICLISKYYNTLATLCDLSNAFDVISHTILLQKLINYGIRGIANKWFENYLSQRTQYVELGNCKSSTQDIKCGVPQGSILGPVLYLIYLNDIGNSSKYHIL